MSGVDAEADWSAVADAAHAEWARYEEDKEIEQLRKDAERYRWIRMKAVSENEEMTDSSFDAEVDAAMEEE